MANLPPESSPVFPEAAPRRRGFLTQATAIIVGGLAGLIPLASGVVFFLDPILRRGKSGGVSVGFLRAASVSDLPTNGTPERFVLRADIHDAWTLYRNRVLGSVYLRLMPNGQIIAFNDTCTHLGCKVDYQAANKRFFCPCHQSTFDVDGIKQNKTPPRDMDSLEVVIRAGEVYVKYQNFKTGNPQKKPISD
ncbi:MAG: Rieske 2Fe-2S domain-containing protein [Candidatus Saccharimonas sp.]|nr:Rieske 2Fe-2S domain-containing protein [Planctomycetaceae bacterium]